MPKQILGALITPVYPSLAVTKSIICEIQPRWQGLVTCPVSLLSNELPLLFRNSPGECRHMDSVSSKDRAVVVCNLKASV